jgi:phosphatidylserine/phosphatidylglycerophosphate/cardiolipin synthase-like enzyme
MESAAQRPAHADGSEGDWMTSDPSLEELLEASLDDGNLSRGERTVLRAYVDSQLLGAEQRGALRRMAFEKVEARLVGAIAPSEARRWLAWLEEVVRLSIPTPPRPTRLEVLESPGDRVWRRIVSLIAEAQRSIDVCVFTVTHDPITRALGEAHRRGVRVRIVSDDEKSAEPGSDVRALCDAGLDVRVDASEHHMHHKVAIFDDHVVLTGSYNWTRAAAESNQDNVLVTDDPRAVRAYRTLFDAEWDAAVPFRGGSGYARRP